MKADTGDIVDTIESRHGDGSVVLAGGLSNWDGLDLGVTSCDCLCTFSGMSTVFSVPAYLIFIIIL